MSPMPRFVRDVALLVGATLLLGCQPKPLSKEDATKLIAGTKSISNVRCRVLVGQQKGPATFENVSLADDCQRKLKALNVISSHEAIGIGVTALYTVPATTAVECKPGNVKIEGRETEFVSCAAEANCGTSLVEVTAVTMDGRHANVEYVLHRTDDVASLAHCMGVIVTDNVEAKLRVDATYGDDGEWHIK